MNIKEYIASGIIESYVLGLASTEEVAEIEQLAMQYPEIKAEIRAIEEALESYAFANAQTPPAHLQDQIWSKIVEGNSKVIDFESGQEIDFNAQRATRISGFYGTYLRIAASVALLGSILANIYLATQWKSTKSNLDLAVNENIKLQKDIKSQEEMMSANEVKLLMDPSVKMSKLVGQKGSENSTVMLAWDTKTNQVYVVRGNLPAPPAGMQYQLWAIIDDKPVDAGVFDIKNNTQQVKKISTAKAFAVTLEKKGGSPVPTSDVMVMGI
ncbi:Anti-sigma-K factor RskA [Emticicia oligotrophica DSM 17448]|uniref:Regulator of SigK n=1 Tax=Emticicia oligotrophica (strain DSM 17448 / CIP 109782 / MTCC 6937 / GPTSA100-15) TaxID=929562 RepID=A0ABN4AN99_EMTOG|nr:MULTISPECIES: anti-sigma factor [Emticicia]AFK03811.1 Anti-sigma-K factor RskA [Emticicia oligotrophica DSM 17448]